MPEECIDEIDQISIFDEPEDDRPSEVHIVKPFDPTKIRVETQTKTIDNQFCSGYLYQLSTWTRPTITDGLLLTASRD